MPLNVLKLYRQAERLPMGRRMFTALFQRAAPYFKTIPALIESVQPGEAVVRMRHTRKVHNHLGTVHAIALCNLAEMAMGLAAEATVPPSHRWIPKAMTVEYLAKARGAMTGRAHFTLPEPLADKQALDVIVDVTDPQGTAVFRARITIWVTARPPGPAN